MEEIRILIIVFCIYGIVYCVYAVKVVLAHREMQLKKLKQIESDAVKINKLYLHIVSKFEETPIENVTYKQMHERIKHYFKYEYSCC